MNTFRLSQPLTSISCMALAVGFVAMLAPPIRAQDPESPPPQRRSRARDVPEDLLATSLEYQELRMRRLQIPADRPQRIDGSKEADLEDLRVSKKTLEAMAKAKKAMAESKQQEAIPHFKKAVELDPDYSKAWNNLGLLYQSMGRVAEAEIALSKAVEANTSNAAAARNLGYLYLSTGRPDQSLGPLTTATKLVPSDSTAAAFLGEAMFQLGRLRESAEELERAHMLSPKYMPVIYRLGCVYAKQERYPEALALLEQVLNNPHPGVDNASVVRLISLLRPMAR